MRDDPSVVALVLRAVEGDQRAWDEIVERYAPLVYAICTRHRLRSHDIEDVGQTVWLLLVEHLGKLREPAALPGWLATTTARECLRVIKAAARSEWRGNGRDDSQQFVDDRAIRHASRGRRGDPRARLRRASRALPATALHAHQRPALFLRHDPPNAGHPDREHRPAACPLLGPTAPVECVDRAR
jgi:RNA polymerase sigma factor (sigma-70 family)